MKKITRFLSYAICVTALLFLCWCGKTPQDRLKLVVEAQFSPFLKNTLAQHAQMIDMQLRTEGISFDSILVQENAILVGGIPASGIAPAEELLKNLPDAALFKIEGQAESTPTFIRLSVKKSAYNHLKKNLLSQTREALLARIHHYGGIDLRIDPGPSENTFIAEMTGDIKDPEPIKVLFTKVAYLELKLVHGDAAFASPAPKEVIFEYLNGNLPKGYEIIPYNPNSPETPEDYYILVNSIPVITNGDITDADAKIGEYGPFITFNLNESGSRKFEMVTAVNIGKQLAIILDGVVLSSPVIQTKIPGGAGQITGKFTRQEAESLALCLKTNALPTSVVILEERYQPEGK